MSVLRVKLAQETVIHNQQTDRPIVRLDGVLVLPVGAEIELVDPNVNARVTRVRLLAAVGADVPATVCLDVELPMGGAA